MGLIHKGGYTRLYKTDAENILDALNEWEDFIGPKELDENDVGLNAERYDELKAKLTKFLED
jgi:hypothetical protein